jgi:hypothetical protein
MTFSFSPSLSLLSSHTAMAEQFIVRSQGLKQQLKLNFVVYDGVEVIRLKEGLIPVFEFADEVELQLVVRRKKPAAASAANNAVATSMAAKSNQQQNVHKPFVCISYLLHLCETYH